MLFFVLHSICFFLSLFFFFIVYSTTTGGAGRDVQELTRAAIETQDETEEGSTGMSRYFLFSALFLLLLTLLLFLCLQYNNRQCWAEPNGTDTGGARDATGGQAGGKRRGEQGTETGGRPKKQKGEFRPANGGGG